MSIRPVGVVLILGDDSSIQLALSDVVHRAFAEAGRGPVIVATAMSEVEVLRALGRGRVDIVIADYRDHARSIDMLTWVAQGRFPTRTLLITGAIPFHRSDDWEAKGVDAIIVRPVDVKVLKSLIAEWFQ